MYVLCLDVRHSFIADGVGTIYYPFTLFRRSACGYSVACHGLLVQYWAGLVKSSDRGERGPLVNALVLSNLCKYHHKSCIARN